MKGRGNYSWSFSGSPTRSSSAGRPTCAAWARARSTRWSRKTTTSPSCGTPGRLVGSKLDEHGVDAQVHAGRLLPERQVPGHYLLIERIAIQGSVPNAIEPRHTLSNRVDIRRAERSDPNEQVDPDMTGGYILEWDFRKGADYNANLGRQRLCRCQGAGERSRPQRANTGEGISSAQKSYIKSYLNTPTAPWRRARQRDWKTYIDQDSAVDYYIAMEYMKPVDGNMWASVYMYKPRSGKLHFGPLWDFDLAAGSATRAGNVASSSSFYLQEQPGNLGPAVDQHVVQPAQRVPVLPRRRRREVGRDQGRC